MKKAIAILLILCFSFVLISCTALQDKVLLSLGKYDSSETYSDILFQDLTEYSKYYFTTATLRDNKYFYKVTEQKISNFNEHLADFEMCVNGLRESDPTHELVINYDFDSSIIDNEDYIYINSDSERQGDTIHFYSYDIYFYDTQTNVLYYFHNNI